MEETKVDEEGLRFWVELVRSQPGRKEWKLTNENHGPLRPFRYWCQSNHVDAGRTTHTYCLEQVQKVSCCEWAGGDGEKNATRTIKGNPDNKVDTTERLGGKTVVLADE